jgi:hypothetical protein
MEKHPITGMEKRLITGIGLHSAAIIAFQLALMQLISMVQWHHFAYMIISVAMLGFGASGTLLALARKRLLQWSPWLVPALMTLSGLLMMVVFQAARLEMFRFDVYLLFSDRSQFPILAANYLLFFLPFFFGALAIGIVFIQHARSIGTYYFSNLLGSGVGGLLILVLSGAIHPLHAPPLIGLLSVGGGLISMRPGSRYGLIAFNILALAISLFMLKQPASLPLSEYKGLSRTLNLPETSVVYSEPDIQGHIEVVQGPALRYAPALSLAYTGAIPVKKQVFVNGDMYGVIPRHDPDASSHILDHTTMALPYVMADREKVLVLRPGPGSAVSQALLSGARRVDAVFENGGVFRLMQTRYAEASGNLMHQDRLHARNIQVRNFLANVPAGEYDMIALPLLESFGGTAGLNALREDYSLTKEAFQLMWEALSPGGVIAVSSWIDYPARTTLKLLATLVETARQNGIARPADHIAAIRSWGTITFVLKKQALTELEVARTRSFGERMYFDPALLPDIQEEERTRFNMIEEASLLAYLDLIMEGTSGLERDYGFVIDPSTDDRPYFSQFLRLKHIPRLSETFGQDNVPFLELGYLIVVVTLVQSLLLALLLIILPLLRLRRSPRRKSGTLLYFGALGLGYMFAEIILIQRFVLYLGHPVYALSAVISTMLIASGAGSLASGRINIPQASIQRVALVVAGILLAYTLLLTPLIRETLPAPLFVKTLLSLVIIAIPAFFMGMMFPLGIRFLAAYDHSQIPWAWGINGCLSVISTSLATLIAVESGFRIVMLVAFGSYLLACACFFFGKWFFRTPVGEKIPG